VYDDHLLCSMYFCLLSGTNKMRASSAPTGKLMYPCESEFIKSIKLLFSEDTILLYFTVLFICYKLISSHPFARAYNYFVTLGVRFFPICGGNLALAVKLNVYV